MASYVFIKDKLVARAEHETVPHAGEMFELESALKDLQKQRSGLAVDFAESVISKSAKIKKLQALFSIPMERINLNEQAMAALNDRCLGLFGCIAYRDGDKISIGFNDYLTCTACDASNDVGDIYCADCGQSFEQMRKNGVPLPTVCQPCFSLLCRCRSICSKGMMLDKDNAHLLGDSCWFNYIPCCLSSF